MMYAENIWESIRDGEMTHDEFMAWLAEYEQAARLEASTAQARASRKVFEIEKQDWHQAAAQQAEHIRALLRAADALLAAGERTHAEQVHLAVQALAAGDK